MIDGFGFRYDLCDPSMGFTSSGRYEIPKKERLKVRTLFSQGRRLETLRLIQHDQ